MTIQTVRELCQSHTDQIIERTGGSPYAMQVARFLADFSGQHGEFPFAELNSDHIRQWLDEHDWSPHTKSTALKAIRAAFRETGRSFDVVIAVPPRSQQRNLVSSETHRRLIDAADPDLANVLEALYFTGARTSELINLDIKHVVDRPEGMFWNRPVDKMGYGNPIAVPAVFAESVLGLMPERKNSAPVFTRADGSRWSPTSLLDAFFKVCRECDVKGIEGYRHSFFRRLLETGVCPKIITILLGYHSSWNTDHVNNPTPEDLLEAVNRVASVED